MGKGDKMLPGLHSVPLWMVFTGLPKHREQEKGVTFGICVPGRFLREKAFKLDRKGLAGEAEQELAGVGCRPGTGL